MVKAKSLESAVRTKRRVMGTGSLYRTYIARAAHARGLKVSNDAARAIDGVLRGVSDDVLHAALIAARNRAPHRRRKKKGKGSKPGPIRLRVTHDDVDAAAFMLGFDCSFGTDAVKAFEGLRLDGRLVGGQGEDGCVAEANQSVSKHSDGGAHVADDEGPVGDAAEGSAHDTESESDGNGDIEELPLDGDE